jgi:hypothetical protein
MARRSLQEEILEAFLVALKENAKRPVVSSNPGGEEGEELRASFPYKGKSPYKSGNIYHDRKEYERGEYARAGDWSSNVSKKNAPHGHQFSSSRTRKIMGKLKAQTPKPLAVDTKVTGLDSANLDVEGLAKRAGEHGRSGETHGGLKKSDPRYHQAAVDAARAGKLKHSWGADTEDGKFGMGGGRTSMRHHQLAGVQPKVKTVSRADMQRAARSATRRDRAERSGKLDAIRARLAKQGKFMRENKKVQKERLALAEKVLEAFRNKKR